MVYNVVFCKFTVDLSANHVYIKMFASSEQSRIVLRGKEIYYKTTILITAANAATVISWNDGLDIKVPVDDSARRGISMVALENDMVLQYAPVQEHTPASTLV